MSGAYSVPVATGIAGLVNVEEVSSQLRYEYPSVAFKVTLEPSIITDGMAATFEFENGPDAVAARDRAIELMATAKRFNARLQKGRMVNKQYWWRLA